MRISFVILLTLVTCGVFPLGALAQPAQSGIDPAEVARWPVETITLEGGRTLSGLIRHEGRGQIEFDELRREVGEPMRRVVWIIGRDRIASMQRLDEQERTRLSLRLREFMRRTEILEGLLEEVELQPTEFQQMPCLKYEGPWFTLRSRADEATTRLAIVRLEQVFAGFRTYLVPEQRPSQTLQIVILGSVPEYQQLLESRKIRGRQTAFFDPKRNEIIAGGQLASVASELEEVNRHHEELTAKLRAHREQAEQQIQSLRVALRQNGSTQRQVATAVRAARDQWKDLRVQLNRQVTLATRRNDALYHRAFRHLYHEAFHAYLGNFVVKNAGRKVPRWLNEGWAQIFESGLLEAGTLRVDAPSPDRLERLQAELRGANSLSLKDVLTAPVEQFGTGHGVMDVDVTTQTSSRLYLYSWGLAYYLTFHRQLLGSSAMDDYMAGSESGEGRADDPSDEIERFEKLVGSSLDEFEAKWKKAMAAERRR